MTDPVNHPSHYTSHPSGVECIQVVEHLPFCVGSAIKYLWRAGLKSGASELEDLEKARWYVERELARRRRADHTPEPPPQTCGTCAHGERTQWGADSGTCGKDGCPYPTRALACVEWAHVQAAPAPAPAVPRTLPCATCRYWVRLDDVLGRCILKGVKTSLAAPGDCEAWQEHPAVPRAGGQETREGAEAPRATQEAPDAPAGQPDGKASVSPVPECAIYRHGMPCGGIGDPSCAGCDRRVEQVAIIRPATAAEQLEDVDVALARFRRPAESRMGAIARMRREHREAGAARDRLADAFAAVTRPLESSWSPGEPWEQCAARVVAERDEVRSQLDSALESLARAGLEATR